MADIRKIIIIFVVAVLFAVLVFAVIEAVYPSPKWEDYCRTQNPVEKPYISEKVCPDVNVSENDRRACDNKKGYIEYTDYDVNGCPTRYECNTCDVDFRAVNDKHSQYVFYISAFLSLIAIFIGLFLPAKANTLNEWIGTGFMLGGTLSLFFGTAISYSSLDRFVRPVVLFLELALIIFIAYRKVGNLRKDKKKR